MEIPLGSNRKPFPEKFFYDVGEGFTIGAGVGSAAHFLSSLRRGERLVGAAQAVRTQFPHHGCNGASVVGLFSVLLVPGGPIAASLAVRRWLRRRV